MWRRRRWMSWNLRGGDAKTRRSGEKRLRRGLWPARSLATGGVAPLTRTGYGVGSREAVYSGNRRVPGLYQRTLADGRVVFELRQRLGGGKLRRVRLLATTKSDAIVEQRALQVDIERGQPHRSPAVELCLSDLAVEWLRDLESRTTHKDA